MSKRIRKISKLNKDAWLNTYADMVTLILVFFVMLYSISSLDQAKFRELIKAFTADPATIEQIRLEEELLEGNKADQKSDIQDLDDLYEHLKNYIETNNLQASVQVEKGKDLVYVRFMSTLFFEADKAVLKTGGETILDFVGRALGEVEPHIKFIRIEGHTAEAAKGTSTVDDRELSTDRANEVLKYLEVTYIKEPTKLMAVGYGMYRPVAPNDTEANRAKNRRVEILIANEDKIYDLNDDIIDN